jgi:hypothetical protein
LPPSKISSPNGSHPTIPSADYAQLLKTLCLETKCNACGLALLPVVDSAGLLDPNT